MQKLRSTLREHLHFIVVVTLLTLVMTFPTIVYVFKTDVFWLPTGRSTDVFVTFWDVWHHMQVFGGQAEYFYTYSMFYPQGVPLTFHAFFLPYAVLLNSLQIIMPITNAFCLAYLLIVLSSMVSAYVYLLYLFEDKWTALFGAVVFGLSPHIVGRPDYPVLAFTATLPLTLYFFHRGIQEQRSFLIIVAAALTGLTCASLYAYVCLIITLGLGICAGAWSRWRDRNFWGQCLLLILAIAIASAWRIVPILADSQSLDTALDWHGVGENRNDLISSFVNHDHPLISPLLESVLQTPEGAKISRTSYLGYSVLLLIGIGLNHRLTRRSMLPWFVVGIAFAIL